MEQLLANGVRIAGLFKGGAYIFLLYALILCGFNFSLNKKKEALEWGRNALIGFVIAQSANVIADLIKNNVFF